MKYLHFLQGNPESTAPKTMASVRKLPPPQPLRGLHGPTLPARLQHNQAATESLPDFNKASGSRLSFRVSGRLPVYWRDFLLKDPDPTGPHPGVTIKPDGTHVVTSLPRFPS